MTSEQGQRKLAAILAADVVGFSRLAGTDEEGTLARLRALRTDLLDPTVALHKGRVVKRTGDGVIVEFRSVVDAARCAIAIQAAMVGRNSGLASDRRMDFRIGVHLGDVVEESDGDLMGDGVNIAARLEGICEPAGVTLSGAAYEQVRDRLKENFADLGEKSLKNIARPLRVYALQFGEVAASPPPAEPPAPPRASIAVLPFANMSGEAEQEYFADGISEDIITALSKLSQLFVIARNSSFTFKGRNVNVGEVAKSLGVRYVLEGSVRRSGSRVRVTAQLIEATTGGHLWAERFDRELTDIFAVQDDVTGHIVSALALNLSPGDREKIATEQTDNLEAYDCFLRGRELWWKYTQPTNREAEALFLRAIDLDPGFASAYASLAAVYGMDFANGWRDPPEQTIEDAVKASRKAVSLDPRNPHALSSLAMSCLWARNLDEALRTAEAMAAANPSYAEGQVNLGDILHYVGRSEEALECYARAIALDPYFPGIVLHFQAQATYQLGRYPETIALLKRRILRNPDTDVSRLLLAASYGQMGMKAEAVEMWRDLMRVNPVYSLELRRKVLPYKDPNDYERVIEGLRKAGLPP